MDQASLCGLAFPQRSYPVPSPSPATFTPAAGLSEISLQRRASCKHFCAQAWAPPAPSAGPLCPRSTFLAQMDKPRLPAAT